MTSNPLAALLRESPVVITGAGCISAAGRSASDLWEAAVAERSAAAWREVEIARKVQRFSVFPAPELQLDNPELHPVRRMDPCVQLAWLAARDAWRQSGLEDNPARANVGVMIGTSRGPMARLEQAIHRLETPRYPPSLSADCTFGSLSGAVAQGLNLSGPTATVSATCASAAYAIALAAEQILLGKADIMLAGGAETPLHATCLAQLQAAGVMGHHKNPQRACRPFDVSRNGLALGEGSAFLVLESARSAADRGVPILARLSGWSVYLDRSGRAGVTPDGSGMAETVRRALSLGGLEPSQINHINLHGTGTKLNDLMEARAVTKVFGEQASTLPCISSKPITGHCLGATPAMEAVLCVEALARQMIPPSANCRILDPECGIHLVTGAARPAKLDHVMSNSLGFWGYHASLIFSRPEI